MKGIEVKKKLQNNGFSLKNVAELMGETPQNLNSMLNVQDIKTGTIERIAKAINKSLYFFLDDKVALMNEEEIKQQDKHITKIKKLDALKDEKKGIPLIPLDAMAGFFTSGEAQIMEYECERYVVPMFREAEFLIPVKGSSMYPKYSSGDLVACKKLPLNDIFFQWNKVYVIDTIQGPLIKRIKEGKDENYIILHSDNPQYDPTPLHKSQIRAVALVVGVLRLE